MAIYKYYYLQFTNITTTSSRHYLFKLLILAKKETPNMCCRSGCRSKGDVVIAFPQSGHQNQKCWLRHATWKAQ